MSKITNDGLKPVWHKLLYNPYGNSGHQQVSVWR